MVAVQNKDKVVKTNFVFNFVGNFLIFNLVKVKGEKFSGTLPKIDIFKK